MRNELKHFTEGLLALVKQYVDTKLKELPPGKDGKDGVDGKDGSPGLDAFELAILPVLDDAKSYARGTVAQHHGGLVRALRDTDPGKAGAIDGGWTCIVRGVDCIKVTQEERNFAVTTTFSDGVEEIKIFDLPVLIYRGSFKEGTEYQHGDVATWDGGTWHCETKTSGKPGTSPAWKLAVSRGRTGKDGSHGKDGKVLTITRPSAQV